MNVTSFGRIDRRQPLNRRFGLNAGTVARWMVLPGFVGGVQWRDLAGPNTGTLLNATFKNWATASHPGGWGSLVLDGSDDYVSAPYSALNLTTTGTIGLWANVTTWANSPYLFSKYAAVGYRLEYAAGRIFFSIADGTTNQQPNVIIAPSTGVWHRIVIAMTGSFITFYMDGVIFGGPFAQTSASAATTQDFEIGAASGLGDSGRRLQGSVDDVFVSTRGWSQADVTFDWLNSQTGYRRELNRLKPLRIGAVAAAASTFWPACDSDLSSFYPMSL